MPRLHYAGGVLLLFEVTNLEIYRASINDMERIITVRLAFIRENHPSTTEAELTALRDSMITYFPQHIGRDCFFYLAMDGETTAAAVCLIVHEQPANLRANTGKLGLLLNVYTHPAYRRRGLATALLKEAIADAGKLGVSVVELQATEAGKAVYKKLGFLVRQSPYTPMEYRLNS